MRQTDEEFILEKIKQLRLIDDSMFNVALNNNIECVELILQIILNDDSLKVSKVTTQYTIPNVLSHGVRFDVLATSNGKVYDIEIQRDDSGAVPRRARYNSSMLDVNSLRAGKQYSELPETYVIFITENDFLKRNKPIYHIRRKIEETDENFNDGTHIIYVNGASRDDTALGRLMQDFFCISPDKINYKILADRMSYLKESKEGVSIMTSIEREIYEKGIERGIERGMERGRLDSLNDIAVKMLKDNVPFEAISRYSELSMEQVTKIAKEQGLIQ